MTDTLAYGDTAPKNDKPLPLIFEGALKRTFSSYSVDMLPEGTGRCAIRLVAIDGPAIVIGWADPHARTAELSTLGRALTLSKQTLGRELRLPPLEYLKFLERATMVLEDFGMKVTVLSHSMAPPAPESLKPSAKEQASSRAYYGLIAASMSLIGAVAWLMAHS